MAKYSVCIARKYKDRNGKEQIHFWNVGKAFDFTTQSGKPGVSVKLYSRTLMTDELVLFLDDEEQPKNAVSEPPGDDDIPF